MVWLKIQVLLSSLDQLLKVSSSIDVAASFGGAGAALQLFKSNSIFFGFKGIR